MPRVFSGLLGSLTQLRIPKPEIAPLPELSSHDALQLRECIRYTLGQLVAPPNASIGRLTLSQLTVHAIDAIHAIVTATISDFAHSHNGHVPINSLPPELLGGVFQWLPFGDLITATHVCKHWRSVALGDGSLWSVIRTNSLVHLQTMLQRSQAALLSVELELPEYAPQPWTRNHTILPGHAVAQGIGFFDESLLEPREDFMTLAKALLTSLRPHMPRIRTLSIRGCWASRPLATLLAEPAPELVHFALAHSETTASGPMHLPADVFGGHAPRLHTLCLASVNFFPGDAASEPDSKIAPLLRVLQSVQVLLFDGQAADLWPIVHAAKRIPEVELNLGFEKPCAQAAPEERPLRRLLAAPSEVRELALGQRGPVRAVDAATGHVCTVRGDAREGIAHFLPASLPHVAALDIDEATWIRLLQQQQGAARCVPRLAQLAIRVEHDEIHRAGHPARQRPLTVFDPRLPVMRCPALERLSIIGPPDAVGIGPAEYSYIIPALGINGRPAPSANRRKTIPLGDLMRFLETAGIPVVVLRRAMLGPGSPEDNARLRSMVADLVIDNS
ncbi:hypothetical protein AURDEDRAFT_182180 [Auricularia subglabra TFB-10046 SS5]|nr:hypothetical protein AURDEDRAFT_182180 [Auricularia subglabra TFB-10046 SS5]